MNERMWRRADPATKRYLEFLETCGYQLSEVEALAAGRSGES
jgi:hypothetical protein